MENEVPSSSTVCEAMVVPVVPLTADPRQQAVSKIYIKNLHRDTSQTDLMTILSALTPAPLLNPFVSRVHQGRRWAKVDVEASAAEELIEQFNFFAGVILAAASAEYARS